MIRDTHTIEEWQKIRGMSREAVADACGVTSLTIRNWQKKPSSMTIGHALRLAEAFDVPITAIDFFLPKK